jgi:ornithine decarboxylase
MRKEGIELTFVNLGGGYPVRYGKDVPTVDQIGSVVRKRLTKEFPNIKLQVAAEPGRFICGNAAVLACRILLRAQRGGREWLHIDAGIYSAFAEAPEGLRYDVAVPGKSGPKKRFVIAGPTCDSADVIDERAELPASTNENDLILFGKMGAYSAACSTSFNGFVPPPSLYLQDLGKPETVR